MLEHESTQSLLYLAIKVDLFIVAVVLLGARPYVACSPSPRSAHNNQSHNDGSDQNDQE